MIFFHSSFKLYTRAETHFSSDSPLPNLLVVCISFCFVFNLSTKQCCMIPSPLWTQELYKDSRLKISSTLFHLYVSYIDYYQF